MPGGRACRPHIVAARSCTAVCWVWRSAVVAAGREPRLASRRRQRGWPRSSQAADAGTPAGGVGGVPAGVSTLLPTPRPLRRRSRSRCRSGASSVSPAVLQRRLPGCSQGVWRSAHEASSFREAGPCTEWCHVRGAPQRRTAPGPFHDGLSADPLVAQTAPGSAARAALPGSPGSPGRWPRFAVAPRRTARPRRDYGCYRDCEGPEGRWWRCWPSSRC